MSRSYAKFWEATGYCSLPAQWPQIEAQDKPTKPRTNRPGSRKSELVKRVKAAVGSTIMLPDPESIRLTGVAQEVLLQQVPDHNRGCGHEDHQQDHRLKSKMSQNVLTTSMISMKTPLRRGAQANETTKASQAFSKPLRPLKSRQVRRILKEFAARIMCTKAGASDEPKIRPITTGPSRMKTKSAKPKSTMTNLKEKQSDAATER